MLRLSTPVVTRIHEELTTLHRKLNAASCPLVEHDWAGGHHNTNRRRTWGDDHRAIEEFVEQLQRILPERRA